MNEIQGLKNKTDGKIYDSFPDLSARKRLEDIEYQPVPTDLAYSHKNLPKGKKTVTVSGSATFGDNAYVCKGVDVIPRKTYNQTFPYNGITITKSDNIYHIEGVSSADGAIVCAPAKGVSKFEINEDISGKSFKLLTFCNQYPEGKLSFAVQFFDSEKNFVNVLKSNGSLSNTVGAYMGSTNGYRETAFSIPENVEIKYATAQITFKSGYTFNHDFQCYMVEVDDIQTVTTENPTATITDTEVVDVFTAPYQSTITIRTPIAEYINYMANNAKGDTATYLTPEAFGAVGDGYADDISAITLCLAMAAVTKQTVIMAKKYLVSAPIDIAYDDMQIIINDIVYNGTETAVKIRGLRNSIKIHSVNSSGVGISFVGDSTRNIVHNDLEINTITSSSHGITFTCAAVSVYQNVVHFNNIKAGGSDCYGIAYFYDNENTFISENNFYGGQISCCDWAVYNVTGNSRCRDFEIEGEVQGGFYISKGNIVIDNPRLAESQRDGSFPFFKILKTDHIQINTAVGVSISEIDLSDAIDTFENAAGIEHPLYEFLRGKIEGKIYARIPSVGENSIGTIYSDTTYLWGKFLILTPYMAYRKAVTTETLDTRLIGRTEETGEEIHALSQLPTKFVVDTVNTEIYLHASYCAFGFNEFEVEQANGFTCKVYDVLKNLIFDGTEQGDGFYKFNVYKDSTKCATGSSGLLRRDFTGHYWQVLKLGATIV